MEEPVRQGSWQEACSKQLAKVANKATDHLMQKVERCVPEAAFREALDFLIPEQYYGHRKARRRRRDAEYDKISDTLRQRNHKWSRLPRTCVVLRSIGLPNWDECMDIFVREQRTDIELPYTLDNLPDALTGVYRMRFLEYQENVLTGPGAKIESGQSKHLHFPYDPREQLFRFARKLGEGGFGEVHEVVGKRSYKQFALKTISREHFGDREKRNLHAFQNELNALQPLDHKHIVQLVGSYTSPDHVGLLMYPVADYDLSEFLKQDRLSPRDQKDRSLRIRNFFGCLAAALDYLHNNETTRVQHKDINPRNILVQGLRVYITDFGTARLHANESNDTTEQSFGGTMRFMTRRYAPPEAVMGSRTYASDIWSLGCVFVEMATVLAKGSLEPLEAHFRVDRSRIASYCEDQLALKSWIEELRADMSRSEYVHDTSLMDIIKQMCEPDQKLRLDARDLVRRLHQLGSPYCGLCCNAKKSPRNLPMVNGMYGHSCGTATSDSITDSPPSAECLSLVDTDSDDLDTISAVGSDELPGDTLEQTYSLRSESNVEKHSEQTTIGRIDLEPAVQDFRDSRVTAYSAKPILEATETRTEHANSSSEGSAPEVRDDASTQSLTFVEAHTPLETSPVAGDIATGPHHDGSQSLLCRWPGCLYLVNETIDESLGGTPLQHHLRDVHLVHEVGLSGLSFVKGSTGLTAATLTAEDHALQLHAVKSKKVRFDDSAETVRERQPDKPSKRYRSPSRRRDSADFLSISPDISQKSGSHERLPSHTRVPSYWLAMQTKVSHTTFQFMSTRPLFVYGTLMFPSVLRSQAGSFVGSVEGTYSSAQGRRLRTISRDWSGMDLSIKTAAEHMTPAQVSGFTRYVDQAHIKHAVAMLQGSAETGQTTSGMLIHGLSDEALACLDHLYEQQGPRTRFSTAFVSNRSEWPETILKRSPITVRISLADGHSIEIEADTYLAVVNDAFSSDMTHPWSTKAFIQSRAFNSLTANIKHTDLIQEEQAIATSLGTILVLPGDELAELALLGDVRQVKSMLRDGYDVNSLSSRHGTALQAAASKGDLEMMKFLLSVGASVNLVGGHYQTPLIAAVVEGHYQAMKLLLQRNAEVFVPGGKYISAIYQAVDFENFRMVHALLEKGAWLTQDFVELLDLADERDNDEIYDELMQYDVRDLHKRRRHRSRKQSTSKRDDNEVAFINKTAGAVCLWEAIKLHNQPGKWTGIKGVQVLRAGMKHGLSETVLEKIRPHVHSFPAIQDFFASAVAERLGGRLQPVRHTDPHRRRFKDSSQTSSALYSLVTGISKNS